MLTPANESVEDEVFVLREDGNEQSVEVQRLHQEPEEVSHDEVLEEHQAGLTAHLEQTQTWFSSFIQTKPKHFEPRHVTLLSWEGQGDYT